MGRLLEGVFASAGESEEYKILGSQRMESSFSLRRTIPKNGTSSTTATISLWVRKIANDSQMLLGLFTDSVGTDANGFGPQFTSSNQILVSNQGSNIVTNRLFRDTASWYHIVCVSDNTNGTASERTRLYVNGERITSFASAAYPALNSSNINKAGHQFILGDVFGSGRTLSGHVCELDIVDGQALDASFFGEFNSTGQWVPKRYSGTHGNNGGYFPLSSSNSSISMGRDGRNPEDSSYFAATSGDTKISNLTSKFGGTSISTDGGGDELIVYNDGNLLGSWHQSDFTLEYWIYGNSWGQTVNGGSNVMGLFDGTGASSGEYWSFGPRSDGKVVFYYFDAGNNIRTIVSSGTVPLTTWTHLAFVKYGTLMKIFINGTESASASMLGNGTSTYSSTYDAIRIGRGAGNVYFNGYFNDIRMTKGVARYKTSFTAPTAALPIGDADPYWDQTAFLIPGNGTHLSQNIKVYSPIMANNNTDQMTLSGEIYSVLATANGCFHSTGTSKFGGTSLYLPNTSNLTFRTLTDGRRNTVVYGYATVEMWFYNLGGGDRSLYVQSDNSSYFAFNYDHTNTRFNLYFNSGSTSAQFSHSIALNAWSHVAFVKNGMGPNNITVYVNGNSVGSATYSGTLGYINPAIHRIGGGVPSVNMYVDDFRFYNGIAKYTENFTPATSEMPMGVEDPYWRNVVAANSFNGENANTFFQMYYSGNFNRGVPILSSSDMYDTPTEYVDENNIVRSTYATFNYNDRTSYQVINGGRTVVDTPQTAGRIRTTMGVTSGKWYWEKYLTTYANGGMYGIMDLDARLITGGSNDDLGLDSNSWGVLTNNGNKGHANSFSSYGTSATTGDIIMCALDMDNGRVWWGKNGVWFNGGNPETGANPAFTNLAGRRIAPAFGIGSGSAQSWIPNVGHMPFLYKPPTGFEKTLSKYYIDEPNILDPSEYFDNVTWTGTSNNATSIPLNFSPDLVWIKNRSLSGIGGGDHMLYDTVRGIQKSLNTNRMIQEETLTNGLQEFQSNGFRPGSLTRTNESSRLYVAWAWDAGSSTVTNTSGTITSQVRANPSSGVSIIEYVGTGSGGTIGHGLGKSPRFCIIKNRVDTNRSWPVFSFLTTQSSGNVFTSTTIDIGSKTSNTLAMNLDGGGGAYGVDGQTSGSGQSHICYAFAEIDGLSRINTFVGNGSTDGPFVYTGFKPAWVLIKSVGATGGWNIFDTKRQGIGNDFNNVSYPNLDVADQGYRVFDIYSNGFKLRGTNTGAGSFNSNGTTFLYIAFAEHPFKYSTAI